MSFQPITYVALSLIPLMGGDMVNQSQIRRSLLGAKGLFKMTADATTSECNGNRTVQV
jgi:hypothetical protein